MAAAPEINTYIEALGLNHIYDRFYPIINIATIFIVLSAIIHVSMVHDGWARSKNNNNFLLTGVLILTGVLSFLIEASLYYIIARISTPTWFISILVVSYLSRIMMFFFSDEVINDRRTFTSVLLYNVGINLGDFLFIYLNKKNTINDFNKNYKHKLKFNYHKK